MFACKDAFNPTEETSAGAAATTGDVSKSNRTESVDLNNTNDPNSSDFLKIEISDALNEKDKVKFTIKTKVNSFGFLFVCFYKSELPFFLKRKFKI